MRKIPLPLFALFVPIALAAQSTEPPGDRPISTVKRVTILSFNVGAPLTISAAAGAAYSREGFQYTQHGVLGSGVFATTEPGLGGIKVSVGYMNAAGMGGMNIQAVAYRTWRESWQVGRNNTYVGAEGVVRLGPFRATSEFAGVQLAVVANGSSPWH